jgi:hypothetical protein
MTSAEFEAELRREGYEIREGEIKPNEHREAHAQHEEHTEADGVRYVSGRRSVSPPAVAR